MNNPTDDDIKACNDTYLAAKFAQQGYIHWKMQDIPAIYYSMVPLTDNARLLWKAERQIRKQYDSDLRRGTAVWQTIGNGCAFIDFSELSEIEKSYFSQEVSTPIGMTDIPRKPIVTLHPLVVKAEAEKAAALQKMHDEINAEVAADEAAGITHDDDDDDDEIDAKGD